MAKYKYIFYKDDEGYYFGLYPNNSDTQSVARSESYASYEEAKETLTQFKKFFTDHKKDEIKEKYMEDEGRQFSFKFMVGDKCIRFYRLLPYHSRKSCLNGINNVFKHFDSVERHSNVTENKLIGR